MFATSSNSELREIISNRDDILKSLSGSPKTKPELISSVEKSRSTIDRAIESLGAYHCVKKDENGTYCLTKTGRIALQTYQDFNNTIESLSNSHNIINEVPPEFELGYEFLKNVEIFEAKEGVPELVLSKRNKIINNSDEFRGLAAVAFSSYPETLLAAVKENDVDLEIVSNPSLIEALYQINKETIATLVSHENTTILVTDRDIPESLWLTNGSDGPHSGITVHSNGGIVGVLINNQQAGVERAEEIYSQYREAAARELTAANLEELEASP
ncbi:helix-turn-helix transcriptional regulator [Natronobacterium texcoconense]|uniref:Predicted transcriptional regulator, contains HTH domain n=1 Tax=Natronobacterium texcoconense TaxID=1095778 RepID=A0A1H1EV59_NATTX|nr:hypothetical protein [Natronobacterium texcoconense]SDQ92016.1 Predicted transcriptional regulator, contains HTH domain [Natronobacterium texcoconense]